MEVRFIKNPVGKYNLSYDIGQIVSLPDTQAKELIEDGYAVPTELPKPENAMSKKKIEKR